MKLSYYQIRLYLSVLSALAGASVSRWLLTHIEAPFYIEGFFRTLPLLGICALSDFLFRRNCRGYYLSEESDTYISLLSTDRAYFIDPVPEKDIRYYRVTEVEKIHNGEISYVGEPRVIILEGGQPLEKGLAILRKDNRGKKFFRSVRMRTP